MEPLLIILVPGLSGGLVLALLIAARRQRPRSPGLPRRLAAPSPSLINMAHIQVEGVGGLGMVAAAATVAMSDPHIRMAMIVASVLGVGLALTLIAMRRRTGALPSGGNGPDNWLTLRIDGDRRPTPPPPSQATIDQASTDPVYTLARSRQVALAGLPRILQRAAIALACATFAIGSR